MNPASASRTIRRTGTMGAAPSLEMALAMEDEQLTTIVEQAYRQDPTRMERIITAAKMRLAQHVGALTTATSAVHAVVDSSGFASTRDGNLETTATPTASTAPTKITTVTILVSDPSQSSSVAGCSTTSTPAMGDMALGGASTDRMAALWTFQGHTLRELRSGLTTKKRGLPSADPTSVQTEETHAVDADGYPILHGSCGREKKYARCSVCYFRGVRCNTAHYCACCQRPVCVRPRTYPGEEHPKICWNVLHVDKDMIQRVDKRRARKLHAASLVTEKVTLGSDDEVRSLAADAQKPSRSDEQADGEPSAAKQRKLASGKASPSPSLTSGPTAAPPPPSSSIPMPLSAALLESANTPAKPSNSTIV